MRHRHVLSLFLWLHMDTFFVSSIWSKAAMELEITDSMIIFSGVVKWEVLPFC